MDSAPPTILSSTMGPLTSLASAGSWVGPPTRDHYYSYNIPSQSSSAESNEFFLETDPSDYPPYAQSTSISQGWRYPYAIPVGVPLIPPAESPAHRLVLNNNKPADFLGIRELQGRFFFLSNAIRELIRGQVFGLWPHNFGQMATMRVRQLILSPTIQKRKP